MRSQRFVLLLRGERANDVALGTRCPRRRVHATSALSNAGFCSGGEARRAAGRRRTRRRRRVRRRVVRRDDAIGDCAEVLGLLLRERSIPRRLPATRSRRRRGRIREGVRPDRREPGRARAVPSSETKSRREGRGGGLSDTDLLAGFSLTMLVIRHGDCDVRHRPRAASRMPDSSHGHYGPRVLNRPHRSDEPSEAIARSDRCHRQLSTRPLVASPRRRCAADALKAGSERTRVRMIEESSLTAIT